MNEETIIEKRPVTNGPSEKKQEDSSWKYVTLGGVPGILLGAGMLYAGQVSAQALAAEAEAVEVVDDDSIEVENEAEEPSGIVEPVEAASLVPDSLNVAHVSDSMSFGEAFAAARAEVGPGGVFYWHGGVYGTYYADEWNAMTAEDKQEYAQREQPAVSANDVPTPTDEHPDIAVQEPAVEVAEAQLAQQLNENFDMGDDVHIVGYANYDDHLMVGYDTDNDGQADVAIIDLDDNFAPSADDVILNNRGDAATLGDLMEAEQPYMAETENPDVASDMPDYMNDANVEVLI